MYKRQPSYSAKKKLVDSLKSMGFFLCTGKMRLVEQRGGTNGVWRFGGSDHGDLSGSADVYKRQGLHCLGDSSGWTRGLMMASVMGVLMGRKLVEKEGC